MLDQAESTAVPSNVQPPKPHALEDVRLTTDLHGIIRLHSIAADVLLHITLETLRKMTNSLPKILYVWRTQHTYIYLHLNG